MRTSTLQVRHVTILLWCDKYVVDSSTVNADEQLTSIGTMEIQQQLLYAVAVEFKLLAAVEFLLCTCKLFVSVEGAEENN